MVESESLAMDVLLTLFFLQNAGLSEGHLTARGLAGLNDRLNEQPFILIDLIDGRKQGPGVFIDLERIDYPR